MSIIVTGSIPEMAEICAELTKNGVDYRATSDGYGWRIEVTGTTDPR